MRIKILTRPSCSHEIMSDALMIVNLDVYRERRELGEEIVRAISWALKRRNLSHANISIDVRFEEELAAIDT